MITLVLGSVDSGKSKLAEDICMSHKDMDKVYIATMIPFGDEGLKRVEKHRKLRSGKGFRTLEWPLSIEERLDKEDFSQSVVLLECMSNLVGNELYSGNNKDLIDMELAQKIIEEVKMLDLKSKELVVVSNSFPLEDSGYDEETKRYVRLIDMVNEKLLKISKVYHRIEDGKWVRHENY